MNVALLALLRLAVVTRGVLMPAARCPPHLRRRFACAMCEEPPAAKLPPPPPESEALQCGVVEVPPGATRVSEAEAARHPAEPDRAIAIVSELRSNAALFAAFAFGALSLPTTLVISESRVTSTTSSLSTSRPVPDSDLLSAFVFLDVATLSCMLVCVVVSQQLIYRLSDGSYEAIRYGPYPTLTLTLILKLGLALTLTLTLTPTLTRRSATAAWTGPSRTLETRRSAVSTPSTARTLWSRATPSASAWSACSAPPW